MKDQQDKTIIINDSADDKNKLISGSFIQACIVDSLVGYATCGVVGTFNPPVAEMSKLNQTLKSILATSTLISTMVTQIPMSRRVDRTGGKKEVMIMIGIAFSGMLTVTILSACTDITTIDRFDWRYAIMLVSGYAIGHGSGAFPLFINTLKRSPKLSYLPNITAIYSSIVDSSNVTTPLVIYFLRQWGYAVPFGVYTGIIFIGGIIGLFLHPAPYDQLKTRFPHEEAKELAIKSGQLEQLIREDDKRSLSLVFKENIHVLKERRGLILNFSFFAFLGSFFVTTTIFPTLLITGFKASPEEAIIASSLANLITILSRPFAARLTAKFDAQSGGVRVHILGCAITIAATIPLRTF